MRQAYARHESVRYGLVVVLVFGADEIKIGFMSSGDKTNLEMELRKRKPGRLGVRLFSEPRKVQIEKMV